MSSKSRIEKSAAEAGRKLLAAMLAVGGVTLGGCSDMYFDRRETISLGANDHIAANRVEQMIDPWPRYVGNKNLAFNGERMQAAAERYRRHEVIRPVSPVTSSTMQSPPPVTTEAVSIPQNNAQGTPAAAVK
jgi:hypothetical protein